MVTIKKYSNRRLYNTETSSYITQEDVVILIKQGKKFKIIDAETKNDITSSILTQVILERENSGMNLIPEDFLNKLFCLMKTIKHLKCLVF
jgi:polyhydroxyalkanoate synthesis repressor PhaR